VDSTLRSPRLRRIVVAYTVNRFGTWFGYVALSVAVFNHTHSTIAVAGLLVAGQVLSALLVPAVVARVETSARRAALSGLYLFETVATAGLVALLQWHFSLPAILVLVALDGTAALAASALLRTSAAHCAREWAYERQPAATGTDPPAAIGSDRLAAIGSDEPTALDALNANGVDSRETLALEAERGANATLNIGFALTFTLGPALAGVIVPAFGAPVALLLDIASFILCGALLLDVKPHAEPSEGVAVRARMRSAWEYINGARTLRRLLLAEGIALIFFTMSGPVEVAYAKTSLHAGDSGYGLLLAAWGLGVAIGSVVFARSAERSLGVLLSASTFAVGLAYLIWAVAPSLAVACGAGVLGGIGNGVQWASLISAVQRLTPQRLQGRLMGAVESLNAVCPAIGFAIGGVLAVVSSPRDAYVLAGAGAVTTTVAFVRLSAGRLEPVEEDTQKTGSEPQPPAPAPEPSGPVQAGRRRKARWTRVHHPGPHL
jgi:predicted MFS family arabinose efflux permease